METQFNHNKPSVMHIDLNSCFATIEQQANPLLRKKPLVVSAYDTPNGCVLSPSIEAKQYGIKTGMTVREAKALYRQVIVRTPDPPMIRDVHRKFRKICMDYSPSFAPKSIDEVVINFAESPFFSHDLSQIGKEIKQRMQKEIGEWISCSIGISTNRFLAKTGASFKKPDGLVVITYKNIQEIYRQMKLTDIHGINTRMQARFNIHGIFTPLQLLHASKELLKEQVYKSVVGYYWYMRLRGWEVDDVDFGRKSYGQQYALGHPTDDPEELSPILMKLCEKMGRRLRRAQCAAQGVHIACVYKDWTHWHHGKKFESKFYTTVDLYRRAQLILNQQPEKKIITRLAVSCYDLLPSDDAQQTLFDENIDRKRKVSEAVDEINDRYGEFVITPALMMSMDNLVIDSIAFGRVREEEL